MFRLIDRSAPQVRPPWGVGTGDNFELSFGEVEQQLYITKMADDTRDTAPPGLPEGANEQTATGDASSPQRKTQYELPKSQVGKLWEAFGNPEESANRFSTTGYSGAKKDANDVSVTDAVKSMSVKDVTSFYKAPCARDSLLLGIGAGFGIGGIRGVLGGETNPATIHSPHGESDR